MKRRRSMLVLAAVSLADEAGLVAGRPADLGHVRVGESLPAEPVRE